MSTQPRIFTKERIANVTAAIAIIWGFSLWTYIMVSIMSGSITYNPESGMLEVTPVFFVVVSILGMMNAFIGFAAKFLWDGCNS